jgi:hypothetical protein
MVIRFKLQVWVAVTRIILRPLSVLLLDEVNIAKRNITTGLFGLGLLMLNSLSYVKHHNLNPSPHPSGDWYVDWKGT